MTFVLLLSRAGTRMINETKNVVHLALPEKVAFCLRSGLPQEGMQPFPAQRAHSPLPPQVTAKAACPPAPPPTPAAKMLLRQRACFVLFYER